MLTFSADHATQTFSIPLPPSLNKLWVPRGGKHPGALARSAEYRRWARVAGSEILGQSPRAITGAVRVWLLAGPPDKRRRDADNLLKASLDLLVALNVIGDDSNVLQVAAAWDTGIAPGQARLHVRPLGRQRLFPTAQGRSAAAEKRRSTSYGALPIEST
jgi:crossover junction endodeoxyribonuclease RusA